MHWRLTWDTFHLILELGELGVHDSLLFVRRLSLSIQHNRRQILSDQYDEIDTESSAEPYYSVWTKNRASQVGQPYRVLEW